MSGDPLGLDDEAPSPNKGKKAKAKKAVKKAAKKAAKKVAAKKAVAGTGRARKPETVAMLTKTEKLLAKGPLTNIELAEKLGVGTLDSQRFAELLARDGKVVGKRDKESKRVTWSLK